MAAPQTILQNHEHSDLRYHGHAKPTIERILECAVALNWKDLTHAGEVTSIQVEYRPGPSQSLEHLKLWSSTKRGFWNLVCEYRVGAEMNRQKGTTFAGGNSSADLPWMLDAIMQHQDVFAPSPSKFLDGVIQVGCPGETELNAARKDMAEAMDRISSLPART